MKFEALVRNDIGKTDTPVHTVARIMDGFRRLGHTIHYTPFAMAEHIHWSQIGIERIGLRCQGKGMSPELASASAHAELAERFSAGLFYQAFEEKVRFNMPALYSRNVNRFLNHEWLNGYVCCHQNEMAHDHVTIESLLRNQTHLSQDQLEAIKASRMAQHWVDGFSLLRNAPVKVPVNFVTYINASNGLAAGNTIEEAMLQAACEVFERHTQIQIIKPETVVPTIDGDTIENPQLKAMMAYYEKENVEIRLKDFSMDGLFPSIGVLYINHNLKPGRMEHKVLVPGVSFNLDEALSRCLTEVMQGRNSLRAPRPDMDRPVMHRSRVDNLYLMFKCCISEKDISFLEKGETVAYRPAIYRDTLEEIEAVKAICRSLDTDFILLDMTHPVLRFPVARVIMPGVSDFLPFLPGDVLTSSTTSPDAAWKGERYKAVMASFFRTAPEPGESGPAGN